MQLGRTMERAATRALMAVAVVGAMAVGSGADLSVPARPSVPEGRGVDAPRAARSRAADDTVGGGTDATVPGGSTTGVEGAAAGGASRGDNSCGMWTGTGCPPPLPPPPAPMDGMPDYPGRYQVDPVTGQIIDTGSASIPVEPVTVETVPTTAPPPPVFLPEPTTTTTPPPPPPTAPPTTVAGLGSAASAPVG